MAQNSRGRNIVSNGVPGMLDNAFQAWQEDLQNITLVTLVGFLPFGIFFVTYIHQILTAVGPRTPFDQIAGFYSTLLTLSLFWKGFWRAVTLHYHARRIESGDASIFDSARHAFRKTLPVLGLASISLLGLIWSFVLVIPIFMVAIAFVATVFVMLEDRSFLQGCSMALDLIREKTNTFFLFQLVYSLLFMALLVNSTVSIWFLVEMLKSFLNIDNSVIKMELSLFNPFFLTLVFVFAYYVFDVLLTLGTLYFYYDARTRRSGADLAHELQFIKQAQAQKEREATHA